MFFRSTNRYGIRSCDWCEKIWFCGDKTWLWPQTEHTHTHANTMIYGAWSFQFLSGSPSKNVILYGVRGCALVLSCLSIKKLSYVYNLNFMSFEIVECKDHKLKKTTWNMFKFSMFFLDPKNCTLVLLQNIFLHETWTTGCCSRNDSKHERWFTIELTGR